MKAKYSDTRGTPPNNHVESDENGNMMVEIASWGISYVIKKDGTDDTFDADGKKLKPFKWKMI